ncbi:MAG: 4a-hydroxytetrahydrobiopterin dehydratase [Prosthecobacter sp.]|jgi:4a-hydroxytetrahydrobiopterin dehydratase|uniref:4a-hydroxytetrahydrobiopterin dehydratase n=1 Tax=Prosthecobacter sp. TaxID=1965333 RepID=UPI0019DB13AD|nr:4a-hydroxytetrahydrobiopterin dehydratase [Prosthecobacter sp.]MBE2283898.1 4a-hydroxytetrahydrobiopterin dehydratase [Prosthecobacter sp.]
MKPALLDETAAQQALASLTGWRIEGKELVKECSFPSYLAGIDFVNRIAHVAEAMNHHPDLRVGWRKVTMTLSTHSSGGLTHLDFELARKADALLASM